MWSRLRRPAKIAASLQMFARSAPARPAVCRATALRSMSSAERLAARVDLEDLLAPGEVGRGDEQLAVEAAGAKQRRVEVLDAVRGGHDDDLVGGREAVELDEQLVQRLVLLAVEAVAAARGADGVELVDEDDRGRVLARGLRRACGCGRRRGPRTSRRTRRRSASRSSPPTRARPPSPAGSCRCRAGRRAAGPSARARRASPNFCGSRRKSTTSWSSAFASSTPATSVNLTDASESGSVRFGFTRGISWIVRQIRKTRIGEEGDRQPGESTLADVVHQRGKRHPAMHRQPTLGGISTLIAWSFRFRPTGTRAGSSRCGACRTRSARLEAELWAREHALSPGA